MDSCVICFSLLVGENQQPGYIIRHLHLSVQHLPEIRTIYQMQHLSWPDHGVLEDYSSVDHILREVHALRLRQQNRSAPVVFHCSAGIGRSGTIIAIDILLKKIAQARADMIAGGQAQGITLLRAQILDAVDIHGTVDRLKKQRSGMVQTKDQYRM